jgi:hypothetical protein
MSGGANVSKIIENLRDPIILKIKNYLAEN